MKLQTLTLFTILALTLTYRNINIEFDIASTGYIKALKEEMQIQFSEISSLLNSLVVTKNPKTLGILDPTIGKRKQILCNDKKEYQIYKHPDANEIDYLFVVTNKINKTNNNFYVDIRKCQPMNPKRNHVIILDLYNVRIIRKYRDEKVAKNEFRWRVIQKVFQFLGMTPHHLSWDSVRINYKNFPGPFNYYETFKKYNRLMGIKRSLNASPPNYKFANDTVHKNWQRTMGLNDIFYGWRQGNFQRSAIGEISAHVFEDTNYQNFKLSRYDFFKINKICLRLDKNCLRNDQLVFKYLYDYSFDTDEEYFMYYMNTYQSYKNNKCSKYYGELLSKEFMDANELTLNYDISPEYYTNNKKFAMKKKGGYPAENSFYTQQSVYLINPSKKCPKKHPRTVFFVNTYNKKSYSQLKKELKKNLDLDLDHEIITNPKYFLSYSLTAEREIFAEVMLQNNFLPRNLTQDENVIWAPSAKRNDLHLNKYQKKYRFLHPQIFKDGLSKFYNKMHKKFPNDYNFVPETYIYPSQKEEIIKKFKNYKYDPNVDDIWMFKPSSGSEGSGIFIIKDWDDIKDVKTKYVLNKYLMKPFLMFGRKFDIRFYVLLTGVAPLKIYVYREGYIRLPTMNYTLDEKELKNGYVHITNTVCNEKNIGVYMDAENLDDRRSNVWRIKLFEDWARENNLGFDEIKKKIYDIFIKMSISFYEQLLEGNKEGILEDRNIMQIYGYDIMIDENKEPVLIEINSKPSIAKDNTMETYSHYMMVPDVLNIAGVVPFAHDETLELYDKDVYEYDDKVQEIVDEALCEFERPMGMFDRIFPLKENIEKYRKFFDKVGPENERLWKTMLEQE